MKRLFLGLILLVFVNTSAAQVRYFILTSYNLEQYPRRTPGVTRMEYMNNTHITPTITFLLYSDSGKEILTFLHVNRKKVSDDSRKPRPWDQMEILEKPVSFLDSIETIDVYELYRHTSYEYMRLKIYLPLYHNIEEIDANKMYVIDRNDIKDGKIKLIQVCVM